MNETGDRNQRLESEAARWIATGRADTETVRQLLILSCHSSPLANQFFESRLQDEKLLVVLIRMAGGDYSGDAQMTASYWASRFPVALLDRHVAALETVAADEWDSVSEHARRALARLRSEKPNA